MTADVTTNKARKTRITRPRRASARSYSIKADTRHHGNPMCTGENWRGTRTRPCHNFLAWSRFAPHHHRNHRPEASHKPRPHRDRRPGTSRMESELGCTHRCHVHTCLSFQTLPVCRPPDRTNQVAWCSHLRNLIQYRRLRCPEPTNHLRMQRRPKRHKTRRLSPCVEE